MVKVEGRAQLKRKFAAMPKVVRDAIQTSLEASAEELVRFQQRLVPKDTGALAQSIGWVREEGEPRVTVSAGGPTAPYAKWVEFGTKDRPPRAWFFPAYRALRKRIQSRTSRAIGKAVKQIAAKP